MPLNCVGNTSSAFCGEVDLPSRYIEIDQIGQGATCVVFKAHDSFLDRKVAIKIMRLELKDYTSVRRFQQEARMMSSFNLKHLPVVLDFGLSPAGRPYMVMELVEGTSLKETIETSGQLSFELAIEITIQILFALQHAHERDIVHRDLKAQNILVTRLENGKPLIKVVDFGLAGEIGRLSEITKCGAALGTPYYMSPEQAQGRIADARSDLYSLGCVLFEMVTGRTPFEKNSVAETLNAHISDIAPSIASHVDVGLSMRGELECMIAKMLEKDPEKRFQCAKELQEELTQLSENIEREELRRFSNSHYSSASSNAGYLAKLRMSQSENAPVETAVLFEKESSNRNGVFKICKVSGSAEYYSLVLSQPVVSGQRRRQDFAMILLVMALAFLSAAALIQLNP